MNEMEILRKLTEPGAARRNVDRSLRDFSVQFGWEPGDQLGPAGPERAVSNGHLFVDYGFKDTAVITFLQRPHRFRDFDPSLANRIVGVSYNNMVDTHLLIEQGTVTFVYNRHEPFHVREESLGPNTIHCLRSSYLDTVLRDFPNPNIPSLDEVLLETISFWKRSLAAEFPQIITRSHLTSLFNALIFVRAAEDYHARETADQSLLLINLLSETTQPTLHKVLLRAFKGLNFSRMPKGLFNMKHLKELDCIPGELLRDLFMAFYQSRRIPYQYDFALMSKHALSKIYEKYVSLLSPPEHSPGALFPPSPTEYISRTAGSVYTPQSIARFFTRYLRENIPPNKFRKLKSLDPACGSGIFLRTLVEQQAAPFFDELASSELRSLFDNVAGIDVDENAVSATALSLSLLHLVLLDGDLPAALNLRCKDALKFLPSSEKDRGAYDVIIANPPFISSDKQSSSLRETTISALQGLAAGKSDTYQAFLRVAIDLLKPGGLGLFVVPHTFLHQQSARKLRKFLHETVYVRLLIDLSLVEVFEDCGAYVALLVFAKRDGNEGSFASQPAALLAQVKANKSDSFRGLLRGEALSNDNYFGVRVGQDFFDQDEWLISSQGQMTVQSKLTSCRRLSDYLQIHQGLITGNDEVFIIPRDLVPKNERKIWRPLLRDRDIRQYSLASESKDVVFYPVADGAQLSEQQLKADYPWTWRYLLQSKGKLTLPKRGQKGVWWMPHRKRDPEILFRPKIVTPHVVLLPRFALDTSGKFAITRAPFLLEKGSHSIPDSLLFFLGLLNSRLLSWLIGTSSQRYSHGYSVLEVRTLSQLPVPALERLDSAKKLVFTRLVSELMRNPDNRLVQKQAEGLILDFYGLSDDDMHALGLQD